MAEPLAEQSSSSAKLKQEVESLLLRITAEYARLDPECASTLVATDLGGALRALRPVYDLGESILQRSSMELDEALVCLRDTRLCELLLSVVRRLPWARMRREPALLQNGLKLLPEVLRALAASVRVVSAVPSGQRAAAYAEMSRRCPSQARCPKLAGVCSGCAGRPGRCRVIVPLPGLRLLSTDSALMLFRYEQLQIYEAMTSTAASLADIAQQVPPVAVLVVMLAFSLQNLQRVRHSQADWAALARA